MSQIEYGIAENEEEFQGVEQLVREVFEDEVGLIIRDLYNHSPRQKENVYLYARDLENGKIVGTLNLLSTPIRYGEQSLKGAEYGVAATASNYRGQGINFHLTEMFFQKCRQLGYNLVVLEGIPYYYRRFGFNYAVPMGGFKLKLDNLNLMGKDDADSNFTVRPAESSDLDYLYREHQRAAAAADFCKIKDREIIRIQIDKYHSATLKKDYFIVTEKDRQVGFFGLDIDPAKLRITDISDRLSFRIYRAIIAYIIKQVLPSKKDQQVLLVDIPDKSFFIRYLKTLGAAADRNYSWQIKILDQFKFLQVIKPVLERRLRDSVFRGEEISFTYNNYRELIKFLYRDESLSLKKEKFSAAGQELKLTPQGAVKLFTGDKRLAEIISFLPDCSYQESYREIFEVLFPSISSHFYGNY